MQQFPILTTEQCEALQQIITANSDQFVEATGYRRRIGIGGITNLSIYAIWRKWAWGRTIRQAVFKLLPTLLVTQHNEVWFLKIPNKGHFDQWQATAKAFKCLIIPLFDGDSVVINHQHYENKKGHGIWFDLTCPHAIPPSTQDQHYLVFLFLPDITPHFQALQNNG